MSGDQSGSGPASGDTPTSESASSDLVRRVAGAARSFEGEARARFIRAQGLSPELVAAVEALLASGGGPAAGARSGGEVPERIGNYKVLRELGKGGMGVVYLGARDDGIFQSRVAIKVVRSGVRGEEVLRRFELERQVLSALNHPNIARFLDGGTMADGAPYFVMEYIEGKRIDAYCDSERLSTRERLGLFAKVCGAVHHAHQNLVVHRDIKPGNILVTAEGEPKLVDFGIAKLARPELYRSLVSTGPEQRLMTPEYASPEQVTPGSAVGTASDVYSLGVVLYELLTGQRPHEFKSRLQHEIARVISEVEPKRPSTVVTEPSEREDETGTHTLEPLQIARVRDGEISRLRRSLSGDIDNIVLMALRKEPRRRYESAAALVEDLRRHLDGMPVAARRETLLYVGGKFVMRNRLLVGAAAVALLGLMGGGIAATLSAREASRQRDFAMAQEREAKQERDLAERRRSDAQAVFDGLILNLADDLSREEGGIEARRAIGRAAEAQLAGESGGAILSDEQRATVMELLADLKYSVRGSSTAAAPDLSGLEAALAMREKAAAERRDDPGARRALVRAILRLGDAKSAVDRAVARSCYERVRVEIASFERDFPRARADEFAKGAAEVAIGGLLKAEKDLAGARRVFDAELARRRGALAGIPPSEDASGARRSVMVALRAVAGVQREQDELGGALATMGEAIEIAASLAAARPSATARRDHVAMRREVESILRSSGKHSDADELCRVLIGELGGLIEQNPLDVRLVRDLADLAGNASNAAYRRRDFERAAEFARAWDSRLASAGAGAPSERDIMIAIDRARAIDRRCGAELQLGRASEVVAARADAESRVAALPESPATLHQRFRQLLGLGQAYDASGQQVEAGRSFQRAVGIAERHAAQFPGASASLTPHPADVATARLRWAAALARTGHEAAASEQRNRVAEDDIGSDRELRFEALRADAWIACAGGNEEAARAAASAAVVVSGEAKAGTRVPSEAALALELERLATAGCPKR
jgi:serine/threonine protein kinase